MGDPRDGWPEVSEAKVALRLVVIGLGVLVSAAMSTLVALPITHPSFVDHELPTFELTVEQGELVR
jgi:hypothetical protein